MTGWRCMVIGLVACGSAQQPAPVRDGARELQPWATDCATKETFAEADSSALEGAFVDCMTGENLSGVEVVAVGTARPVERSETTSDASGRYHMQLPEGIYHVLARLDGNRYDLPDVTIQSRRTTFKESRLELARCPPASSDATAPQAADRDALIAAVLDHHAAAGIVDAPRFDQGPTYVSVSGSMTPVLPSSYARRYIVRTDGGLQSEATRTGRDVRFIRIFNLDITGSCATVLVGGDIVFPKPGMKMCCCSETEVFLKRGGRWMFRTSRVGSCS